MGFCDKINYSMIVNAFKTTVYKGKGQTYLFLQLLTYLQLWWKTFTGCV